MGGNNKALKYRGEKDTERVFTMNTSLRQRDKQPAKPTQSVLSYSQWQLHRFVGSTQHPENPPQKNTIQTKYRSQVCLLLHHRAYHDLGLGMFWIAILFLIAALPWAFPVAARARPMSAVIGVLLLGTVLGPNFFAIDGPIQLSLDRLAWAGLMLIVVMRLVRRIEKLDSVNRVDMLLYALVAWVFLSCVRFGFMNADQPPIAKWLFFFAMPCTVYVAMRLRQSGDEVSLDQITRWLGNVIVVLGIYLSLTSVFEMLDLRALVFPKFINDPKVWEFYGRGRGPLLNPAGNGILMTLFLSVCVTRFFGASRHGMMFYAFLALLAIVGCYSTLTRSVWIGAAISVSVLCILYVPVRVRMIALIGTLILGGLMTTGLKEQILSIKRDKALSAAEAAKSIELRPLLAVVAWEMFKDRPLAGHGLGQYYEASEPYHTVRHHGIPLETVRPYVQHNIFLAVLVDLGMIGLVLYVLFLITLFCIAWKLCCHHPTGSTQRSLGMMTIGLMCCYVCNGMFHDVAIIEMVHMYLFVLAGLTVTAARQSSTRSSQAQNPRRRNADRVSIGFAARTDTPLMG